MIVSEVVEMTLTAGIRPTDLDSPGSIRARRRTTVAPPRVSTALLLIREIHCGECAGHLELALEAVRGIERAEVDADIGVAWVTFEPDLVRFADIVSGIRHFGYENVDVVSVALLPNGSDPNPDRAA